GHMESVNLGTTCWSPPCTGSGPWVAGDLENGLYQGAGADPANLGNNSQFVTAMLKSNNQTTFEIEGGNSQSGGLNTWYNGDLTHVNLWSCQSGAIDQHWTHNSDNSLETLGRCLDIDGDGTAVGTKVELWDCNGVGGQKWIQRSNGSLLNPQSGLCLDDPSGN